MFGHEITQKYHMRYKKRQPHVSIYKKNPTAIYIACYFVRKSKRDDLNHFDLPRSSRSGTLITLWHAVIPCNQCAHDHPSSWHDRLVGYRQSPCEYGIAMTNCTIAMLSYGDEISKRISSELLSIHQEIKPGRLRRRIELSLAKVWCLLCWELNHWTKLLVHWWNKGRHYSYANAAIRS